MPQINTNLDNREGEYKVYKPEDFVQQQIKLDSNITSGLTPEKTFDWQTKNQKFNSDWEIGNNIWNGAIGELLGPVGALEAVLRSGAKARQEKAGTDYDPDARARADLQDVVEFAGKLEDKQVPVDMKNKTFGAQVVGVIAQNFPQILLQMEAYKISKGWLNIPLMFAQIFGRQYRDQLAQGVKHEDAAKAAASNAAVQSVLERIGLGSWMKLSRGASWANVAKGITKAAATEATTEVLQEIPEQVTDLWALHKDMSPEELGELWWKRRDKYFHNMILAGIAGAFFGAAGGGVNSIQLNNFKKEFTKARVDALGEIIEQDKAAGVSPEYVAASADTDLSGDLVGNDNTVYIEAVKLNEYFQEVTATSGETEARTQAQLLGTTLEEVAAAAANGGEIKSTNGGLRGASLQSNGALFNSIKNHVTFDMEEYSLNVHQGLQELIKKAYKLDTTQKQELYNEVGKLEQQLVEAGATKEVAKAWRTVMISRAMRYAMDKGDDVSPAQIFKDYPLRFVKGKDGQVGVEYGQNAGVLSEELNNPNSERSKKFVEAQKLWEQHAVDPVTKEEKPKAKVVRMIFDKTGFFKGADGQWRYVIKDDMSKVDFSKYKDGDRSTLGEVYDNKELWNAYPLMKDYVIEFFEGDPLHGGSFDSLTKIIRINLNSEVETKKHAGVSKDEGVKLSFLHELQHAIQDWEGFATGASPSTIYQAIGGSIVLLKENVRNLGPDYESFFVLDNIEFKHNKEWKQLKEKLQNSGDSWGEYKKITKKYRTLVLNRDSSNVYRLYKQAAGEREAEGTAADALDNPEYPSTIHDVANTNYVLVLSPYAFLHGGQEDVGKSARQNLTSDIATWKQIINNFLAGNLKNVSAPIRVMQTPLVMQIAGAKNIPIKIDIGILSKILNGKHHKEMTASVVSQIPGALTDPMLIYRSPDKNGKTVLTSVLSLQDTHGDYVIVPVVLEESENGNSYLINKIETAYGKKGVKRGNYLQNNVSGNINAANKNLLYTNTKKTAAWARSAGLQLPIGLDYNSGSFDKSIANENDLVKLKNENPSLYQTTNQRTLGSTSWAAEGEAIIKLFDGADASTVFHETMHYFLNTMVEDVARGAASEQQQKDLETLLEYAGTTTTDFLTMDFEGRRKAHEHIAEAFETYLKEGKAPSRELRNIFQKIKDWLLAIYQERERNENYLPLTDEVRQVFDSMLACDAALKEVELANGYLAAMPKEILDQLDDKSKARLQDQILKVHDKAVEILAKKATENFSEERKKAIAKYQEDILDVVVEEIKRQPLYQAMENLRQFTELGISRGAKANVRAIARRYLNEEGKTYTDWKEEWDDINAQLSDMIDPVIDELKRGMGNGTYWVDTEFGQTHDDFVTARERGCGYRVSNNDIWYQNYFADFGRPTALDLYELAIQNLIGTSGRYTLQSYYGMPEEYYEENKAILEPLLKRKEELENLKEQAELGKHKGLSPDDRASFDVAAEAAGYANGQELAYLILNMPTEKQAIAARVEELTKIEFPNFWEEKKTAVEAAKEALYNDPHAELIALEEQLMYDALNNVLATQHNNEYRRAKAKAEASAAKAEAMRRIRTMSCREARLPLKFIKEERNAAVNAALATAKGDIENAVKFKHQQLVAHQMVGYSMAFREHYERTIRKIKKIKNNNPSYWFRQDVFLAAGELMTRMGLKVKDYDVAKHYKNGDLQSLVDKLTAEGWTNLYFDNNLLNKQWDITRPGTLTVDEFTDLLWCLQSFRAVARCMEQADKDLKAESFAQVKAKVLEQLGKLNTKFLPKAYERSKAGNLELAKAAMRSTDNLFEMMDNWEYGYFSNTWDLMLKHAADREIKYLNLWDDRIKDITQTWSKSLKKKGIRVDDLVSYEDLGLDVNGRAVQRNRHNLIAMLCYLGSDSGTQRLCGTPLVDIAQSDIWVAPADNTKKAKLAAIDQTRQNLEKWLQKHITKEDVEYAQAILDSCNLFWPELEAVNLRTTGFAPEKVEPVSRVYFIDGEVVPMRGGYCPLKRNGDAGSHPIGQQQIWGIDTDEHNQGRFINTMNTTTAASSNRTNAAYPVDIEQGWFDIPIRDTIHDICYRECMQEWKKLLNDDEIANTMKEKLGIATFAQLREMLQSTAQPYGGASMQLAEGLVARCLNLLRRRTVQIAILGNLKTAAQNISNIYLFGNAIDGFSYADVTRAVFNGFVNSFSKAGWQEMNAICNESPFFKEREKFMDFSIRDIAEKSKLSKIEEVSMKWGTVMLVITDNLTAKPVYVEAYKKKFAETGDAQAARDFADAIIRRTLGSSRIQDVASIQRGGPYLRLFTTFQSFFNTQYNQWAREYNIARRLGSEGRYKEAAARITTFVAAKYFFVCLLSTLGALKNPLGNDNDDDDKLNNLQRELLSYPLSLGGPTGQIANVFVQKLYGIRSYGYKMNAAQSAIDKVTNLGGSIGRVLSGDADSLQEFIEPAVGVVGLYYGVPDQINKLFWNAYDIVINDMDPEWRDLMRRRPKRER